MHLWLLSSRILELGSLCERQSWKYSIDQQKGKRFPRAIRMRPASCQQSTIFLAAGTMQATGARESKHEGDGNQFMGVVQLPEV